MLLANAPAQLVLPWGNGDSSKTNPIPVPSQISITPGAASWTDGFPPLCATAVTSGGVPPTKADMNGGLFQMSAVDVWICAGGGFPYSSAFSTAIGGYPKGARVLMASGLSYWRSIVDNNTTDPDTGGAGWVGEPGTESVNTTAVTVNGGSLALQNLMSYAIPAGSLNVARKVKRITMSGNGNIAGAVNFNLGFALPGGGGTGLPWNVANSSGSIDLSWRIVVEITTLTTGASGSVLVSSALQVGQGAPNLSVANGEAYVFIGTGIDLTSSVTLQVQAEFASGAGSGDTVIQEGMIVEALN